MCKNCQCRSPNQSPTQQQDYKRLREKTCHGRGYYWSEMLVVLPSFVCFEYRKSTRKWGTTKPNLTWWSPPKPSTSLCIKYSDYISYGLILLRFWICVLIIMARESVLRHKYFSSFFLLIILFLLIMLFCTFGSINLFSFYFFLKVD